VRTTGARKTYIEALMAFADGPSTIPVAAFARRRHLFGRIQLIAKERVMSVHRIALSSLFLAAVTLGAVAYASHLFPLHASPAQQVTLTPGPLEGAATPVSDRNAIPRVLASPAPRYPAEAAVLNATGAVAMKLVVDQNGNVAEARPIGFAIGGPGLTYRAVRQDPLPAVELMFRGDDPLKPAVEEFLFAASDAAYSEPAIKGKGAHNGRLGLRADRSCGGVSSASLLLDEEAPAGRRCRIRDYSARVRGAE